MTYLNQIEQAYQIIKSERKCNVNEIARRMKITTEEAKGLVGQLIMQGRIQQSKNKSTEFSDLFPWLNTKAGK